jgi:hypothetical protein
VTGTILLGGVPSALLLTDSLTIVGPGSGLLTVDANSGPRAFGIGASAAQANISGLSVTGGNAVGNVGGGIGNWIAELTLTDVVIRDNAASGSGGGLFHYHSEVRGNP